MVVVKSNPHYKITQLAKQIIINIDVSERPHVVPTPLVSHLGGGTWGG